MKKCLDCEYLEASRIEDKTLPEMFQSFIYLHCKKYNHAVVGYDRKGEDTDCMGFNRRKKMAE